MFHHSRFQDLMKFFPSEKFSQIVKSKGADRYRKHFRCRDHVTTLIYSQLSGHDSLRGIEDALNEHRNNFYHIGIRSQQVCRSTLSRANNQLNPEVLEETLPYLISQVQGGLKKEANMLLQLMDSSTINVSGQGFEWADKQRTMKNKGLKLHVLFQPDPGIPSHVKITDPTVSDLAFARNHCFEEDITYVFDRGYYSFAWWKDLLEQGVHFLTRLKKNSLINIVEQFEAKGDNILSDSRIALRSKRDKVAIELRCVEVQREGKKEPLILITDRFDLAASEIASLYKGRWQIELFFKWIKQRLKIKKFLGRSKNAVKIQILAAIIAFLLLAILKKATKAKHSLTSFMRKMAANLMRNSTKAYRKLEPERASKKQKSLFENYAEVFMGQ